MIFFCRKDSAEKDSGRMEVGIALVVPSLLHRCLDETQGPVFLVPQYEYYESTEYKDLAGFDTVNLWKNQLDG